MAVAVVNTGVELTTLNNGLINESILRLSIE